MRLGEWANAHVHLSGMEMIYRPGVIYVLRPGERSYDINSTRAVEEEEEGSEGSEEMDLGE